MKFTLTIDLDDTLNGIGSYVDVAAALHEIEQRLLVRATEAPVLRDEGATGFVWSRQNKQCGSWLVSLDEGEEPHAIAKPYVGMDAAVSEVATAIESTGEADASDYDITEIVEHAYSYDTLHGFVLVVDNQDFWELVKKYAKR